MVIWAVPAYWPIGFGVVAQAVAVRVIFSQPQFASRPVLPSSAHTGAPIKRNITSPAAIMHDNLTNVLCFKLLIFHPPSLQCAGHPPPPGPSRKQVTYGDLCRLRVDITRTRRSCRPV